MRLVVLFGMPATGKLTVGRELAALTGYKLFHNHLVVDLLLSVFEFGSPGFVEMREQIWLGVVRAACREGVPGMIFTFAPETTVRPEFMGNLVETVKAECGTVEFVELTCPVDELKRRMDGASRRQFKKLTSVELFDQLRAGGKLELPMPRARFSVDTSSCSAAEAAEKIVRELALPLFASR
jgi:AAA domain